MVMYAHRTPPLAESNTFMHQNQLNLGCFLSLFQNKASAVDFTLHYLLFSGCEDASRADKHHEDLPQ